jgi:arylsulfatase A-like enzyme
MSTALRARAAAAGAGLLLVVSLSTAGCGTGSEPLPPHAVPLEELADSARSIVETVALDLGEPAAREAIWSGWGPDERSEAGSFVWGAGEGSRLRLDVVEPRSRRLRLRGWSFPFASGELQEVRVELNGVELGRRRLGRAPVDLEIEAAEDLWRPGENQLELRYERHHEAEGERPWAAGWESLRLGEPAPAERPAPRFARRGGGLELPARTALEWGLELPGGAWLAWDELESTGAARLRVDVFEEDGSERTLATRGRAGRLPLTADDAPRRLRGLRLRAIGRDGSIGLAGARLHVPEIPPPDAAASAPTTDALRDGAAAVAAPRPNLIVYVVDTLRADRLGCYGYPRPTSPQIDRFATQAVLWREGRAQASWTRPAMATIVTGLHPIGHGAQQPYEKLPDAVETIAERLGAAGYETAMFTANANTAPRFGFDQGWQTYRYLAVRRGRSIRHLQSAEVHREVVAWLERRDPNRPFLLLVHTIDPHDPYQPATAYRRRLAPGVDVTLGTMDRLRELAALEGDAAIQRAAALSALYDAEIAQNDASFGQLLAELERRGLAEGSAVLLTSDHGEEFYEHGGWKHGFTLHEEQLRVPFVLRLPGRRHGGTVRPGAAEQIDVVPTLLELAGVEPPRGLPGRSLLADAAGATAEPRPSFAWLERPGSALRSALFQQWKLVVQGGEWVPPAGRAPYRLFALASDPAERDDLALAAPLRRRWLEGLLAATAARHRAGHRAERAVLDPELEAGLRALGYL